MRIAAQQTAAAAASFLRLRNDMGETPFVSGLRRLDVRPDRGGKMRIRFSFTVARRDGKVKARRSDFPLKMNPVSRRRHARARKEF